MVRERHALGMDKMIQTTRLQLIVCEFHHLAALGRDRRELAALLGVTLPDSWPHFPEAYLPPDPAAPTAHAPPHGWSSYLFIHQQAGVLVGSGGFKGPPGPSGTVEIGYEIATEYWNQGYASEATQGMLAHAFAHEAVRAVMAHTLAQTNASTSVLKKVGMSVIAEVDDPDDGPLWRWQIRRDEFRPHSTYAAG